MDKKLLDALAAKAEQRKADKAKAKQFPVGGQMLDFVQFGLDAKLDAYEAFLEARGSDQPVQMINVGAQLIYDCCPALQSPELHAALGVTDPYDTVWALMDVAEVNRLALEVYEWLGLMPRDEDEDPVKN